jgi:hypothetical protein
MAQEAEFLSSFMLLGVFVVLNPPNVWFPLVILVLLLLISFFVLNPQVFLFGLAFEPPQVHVSGFP